MGRAPYKSAKGGRGPEWGWALFQVFPHLSALDTDVIHMIKSTRASPPFLHTASDQKLDDGKAWE